MATNYTNSPLVGYTRLVDKHSGERTHAIDRITPHCVVGQVTVARLGDIFSGTRAVSSNYGIALNGTVGLYVEEKNRSWCSSSNTNDQRAITIKCASDPKQPYAFKPIVYEALHRHLQAQRQEKAAVVRGQNKIAQLFAEIRCPFRRKGWCSGTSTRLP